MMMRVTIGVLLYQCFFIEYCIVVKEGFEIHNIASLIIRNILLDDSFAIYLL